jgi:hypothetical protein
MTNPIEAAVLPLKQDAIDRAAQEARKMVEHMSRRLTECENNADTLAPYPRYNDPAYKEKLARHNFLKSLTTADKAVRDKAARKLNEPNIRFIDNEKVELFVQQSMDIAAAQYVAFVAKLCNKIFHCVSAELDGNHVWSHSILTVTYSSGAVERYKTQMIVNVSKHGKLFNQWPTRKVK